MKLNQALSRPAFITLFSILIFLNTNGCQPQDAKSPGPSATPTNHPREVTADSELEEASIVFYNGVILTMENESTASAIAIKNESILAVGSNSDIIAYAGPNTTQVDLEGRTLMPGFVDAHSHIFNNPWREDLEGGQTYLLSNGITTSADMFVEESLIQEMRALDQAGKLRMRISLYPLYSDNCGDFRGEWFMENYPVSRQPGTLLQIPGVKLFNDGGSCNAPAVSYQFKGGIGQGNLYYSSDEMAEMVISAMENGYQVAIHGLGDRAIETNLDAIEKALAGGPNLLHHRIDHNAVLRDDLLPRYSEVGAVAVIFGHFPTCIFLGDTSRFKYFPPDEYLDWEWRWRDLIDANPELHIAWHSDTPISIGPYPLEHLQSFVTRIQYREDGTVCEPPEWAADDLLSVAEALPIMTYGGAYALQREDEIGSLAPGKLADLIILSDNPFEVNPRKIAEIQVLMTMVGGQVEYCSEGQQTFCP
ncbi:MAG: amidohydrolase family protein [Chloroflexota bacterium]